ncbi:multicopper oxidase family protein [Chelatococcus daeguensis]|nr:multicopper oxidase family protein [Chelatococcus daeguensis]
MAPFEATTISSRSHTTAMARRTFVKALGGLALFTGTTRRACAQPAAGGGARLVAAPATVPLNPSAAGPADLWSFTGDAAGARLRAPLGEALALHLTNELPQPVSMHVLGLRTENALDGAAPLAGDAVPPGGERSLTLTPVRPGTFLLRPAVLAHAAEQSARGLYGTLIVPEPESIAVDEDVIVVLSDWALEKSGALRASFGTAQDAGLAGRLGNWLTVNGVTPPQAVRLPQRGRARLRLVNAANARIFTLRFDAMEAEVIAVDSIAVEPFAPARAMLTLLPGGRLDVVVTPGEGATVSGLFGTSTVPLVTFAATGAPSPHADEPRPALAAPDLPAAIDLAAALRAEAVIGGGLDPNRPATDADVTRLWQVNGAAFTDQREPLLRVPRGKPAVLAFTNQTAFVQALHIHGHHVRLLHPLDDGWEPYWLDTFAVPPGRTVRIAFVADNPGRWLIGSAILDRLPAGLATWYEVT